MPSGIPDKRKKTPEQLAAAVASGEIRHTIDGTTLIGLYQSQDGLYRGQCYDKDTDTMKWRVWGTDGSTTEGTPVGLSLCTTSAAHRREWNDRSKNKKS
jgi:hypothetical protein